MEITTELTKAIETKATAELALGAKIPFAVDHDGVKYVIADFRDEKFFECDEIAGFTWDGTFLAIIAPDDDIPNPEGLIASVATA